MEYIYHRVVDNMQGKILYPLNVLKDKYPDQYAEHVKKYQGREQVLKIQIPILNCLWNDVLHFTAVPPETLFANLKSTGFEVEKWLWKKWYKIPADLLESSNTIVCLYERDLRIVPDATDFYSYDPNKIEEYRKVPQVTLDYYKEKFDAGERPLLFHHIPHILYKGAIDVTGVEIIDLS
ncbi:MAG: hypothetical protein V4481_04520 [Patescibacteria group bacterium]